MNQNVIFRLLQETDINAKYDAEAKKLLSNKEILSRILKYSVDEFKDFSISEIIDSIEGEPVISKINVHPGHSPENITGISNTDKEINEGEITFDIIFHVITPHNLWGNFNRNVRYDLLSVVMIRLAESNKYENPLIKLLDTILSEKLTVTQKQEILEKDFAINRNFDRNGGLNIMCNLSAGIEEKAMQKGIQKGTLVTLYNLYKNKTISLETAAQNASMTVEEFLSDTQEYTS